MPSAALQAIEGISGLPSALKPRLSLAAGVGVGDLYALHVGSAQRWEHVVWGEPLAEMVRAVQEHARPGDTLASHDVLSLAPDALRLSGDLAKHPLPQSLLLISSVRPDSQTRRPPDPQTPDP